MSRCDTLLMVGTTFPYSEFLPPEGAARAVQIDLDPRNVGIRYPAEVNLIGDSADTLRRLLPLLNYKADRSWRKTVEENVSDWWLDVRSEERRGGQGGPPRWRRQH